MGRIAVIEGSNADLQYRLAASENRVTIARAQRDTCVAALEHIARACAPGSDQSDDELKAFIADVLRLARSAIAKVS